MRGQCREQANAALSLQAEVIIQMRINTTHLIISLYACPANHLHALTSSKALEHGCFEVIGQNILSIRSLQPSFKTS